jgi:predicted amidohydrolase
MAGEAGADLVVSLEYAINYGEFGALEKQHYFMELVEEIPGPTSEKASALSKKYNMYTATNYAERDGDKIFNTTVLIGRDGKIIGKYRKIHLPAYESWYTTPGSEYPVFETDIGRIGFAICHDMAFPEHCRNVALNGADIILNSTGGWGFVTNRELGLPLLQVRAAENCVYIANAYCINPIVPGSSSCIISNRGEVLAENKSMTEDGIAMAEIKADYEMIHDNCMWNFFSDVRSERIRFMLERMPKTYGDLCNENPPLMKDCYPGYKYARTPDELKEISKIYNKARQDEENGITSELFKKEW